MMAGMMAVVVVLSGAAMVVSGYVAAYHRARAAADLTALSAAVSYQRGGDPCAEARRLAVRNGAQLTDCERVGDEVDFVITVAVTIAIGRPMPGLPGRVRAEAHAGPVS